MTLQQSLSKGLVAKFGVPSQFTLYQSTPSKLVSWKENFTSIPASRLRHTGPLHFCTTPPCLQAAADILGSQNSSYSPCTDFWNYACRGWLTRQPIPQTRSRWSTIEEMDFQLRVDKSRIIAMSSHEPSQFNSNEWKVDNFYQVTDCKVSLFFFLLLLFLCEAEGQRPRNYSK